VKYFRHILEAHHVIIFTDHKPITYAFQQKRDKCSPPQFNHLDLIPHDRHTTHLRRGQRCRRRSLSRVESVTAPPSHEALAEAQNRAYELQTLLTTYTQPMPGTTVSIYYDTSAGKLRPYILALLLLQVFQ
jgi:hypothetical protein